MDYEPGYEYTVAYKLTPDQLQSIVPKGFDDLTYWGFWNDIQRRWLGMRDLNPIVALDVELANDRWVIELRLSGYALIYIKPTSADSPVVYDLTEYYQIQFMEEVAVDLRFPEIIVLEALLERLNKI